MIYATIALFGPLVLVWSSMNLLQMQRVKVKNTQARNSIKR